ncbi:MAG: DUF3991 domain-containing protein [Hominenteromicrobium sp.]|uniref:DUF3991 domain-containing protein n=1 Tax=Hominenteromicrobium sp. TaxID=3073581 RepID=UPI003995F193
MIPVAFCLPPAAPDNRRLYAYLTHTRGIAHEIVNTFIDEHLIYQDKQGNIVFVCYDRFGRVKSAHKRGTNSAQRYRGFVTGGEFSCGFSYANDNATVLYVFGAPIDLMSFLTLHRHEPWHRASYLSLGGLSEDPLRRFLKEHKSIQRIAFCFDNDINKPENKGKKPPNALHAAVFRQIHNLYFVPVQEGLERRLERQNSERRVSMTPQQIIFLSIVGIALVALIFLSESQKRYNLDSIKRKTVGDGQYGTARWATQEEIQSSTIRVPYEPEVWRYNEESRPTTTGIVVNLTHEQKNKFSQPSILQTATHLMVAGTGGGKTTTFMIPNIEYALACGTSFISTDSKVTCSVYTVSSANNMAIPV